MRSPRHPTHRSAVAGSLLAILLSTAAQQAQALTVDGSCTLTDAILAANTGSGSGLCPAGAPGADVITLDVDVVLGAADTTNSSLLFGTYAGLPDVTSDITIEAGLGSVIERDDSLGCSTNDPSQFRIVQVTAGSLTLEGLTMRNGCSAPNPGSYTGDTGGGGILVTGGDLVLSSTSLVGNSTRGVGGSGTDTFGALWMQGGGALTVAGGAFTGNRALGSSGAGKAWGGAVAVETPATFNDARFVGNRAQGGDTDSTTGGAARGGALALIGSGSRSIADCSFLNNTAQGGSGVAGGPAFGGALHWSTLASLTGSEIAGNLAQGGEGDSSVGGNAEGGGIYGSATELLDRLRVHANRAVGGDSTSTSGGSAEGGGLFLQFADYATVLTIDGNEAHAGGSQTNGVLAKGGGARLQAGTFTNVTVFGNRAVASSSPTGTGGDAIGGGVFQESGSATFLLFTVAENAAIAGTGPSSDGAAQGGGLWAFGGTPLTLGPERGRWRDVDADEEPFGLRAAAGVRLGRPGGSGSLELGSSLIADNWVAVGDGAPVPEDCTVSGGPTSLGYNLIETPGTGCSIAGTGDQVGVDPLLGPLGDQGCVSPQVAGDCLPTVPIDLTSPAIDQGSCTLTGETTDGRNIDRPANLAPTNLDDGCDIGAFEARPVRFVDLTADGNDDGTSWDDAFPTLQDALSATLSGDELWIAAGAYFPDVGGGQSDGDPFATFFVPDGARLLGGFLGDETLVSDRDWTLHRTVLSGDVDGNDTVDADHVTNGFGDIAGTNSFHVVTLASPSIALVLDGLVLTGGQATGASPDHRGAAILCDLPGTPTLRNVTVIGNRGENRGAIYECTSIVSDSEFVANRSNDAGGVSASGGKFRRTAFRDNSAGSQASLFYLGAGLLELTDVVIEGNNSDAGSGAVRSLGELRFDNVLLRGNFGGTSAAVYLAGSSDSVLRNVTVTGNDANSNGAIHFAGSGSLTIDNSILWNNRAGGVTGTLGASLTDAGVGTVRIRSSILQGSGGSGAWAGSPSVDGGGNLDQDPLFLVPTDPSTAPTTAGDSHLVVTSPGFDAGDDALVATSVDLDGAARVQNMAVDLGAYETPYVELGDSVWLDEDEGGDYEPGEFGFEGVSIELWNAQGILDTTTSDADGLYGFWVTPGDYFLVFTPPPGYDLSPQGGAGLSADSDPSPIDGTTPTFTVGYASDPTRDAGVICADRTYADGTLSGDVVACGTVTLGENLVVDGPLTVVAGERIVLRNGFSVAAGQTMSLTITPF